MTSGLTPKTPNIVMGISIATMFLTVGYAVFVPARSAKGIARSRTILLDNIDEDIKRLESSKDAATKVNKQRLLAGDADSVTSELMRIALVTAKQYQLELTSVRPQRTAKLGIVDERAFAIQLTGPSQSVVSAIRSMDNPKSRFVVRSIQLSPQDSAGVSMVSANIVVVGYQAPDVAIKTTKPTTTRETGKK
ncbi:MAG: hypothetical protein ACOYLC_05845 [Armatimonadaceae bacterium]|jgi:hypothetical protein